MNDLETCRAPVYWWGGEYENECDLLEGHDGPHYGGLNWYNDEMEEVEAPDEDESDDESD